MSNSWLTLTKQRIFRKSMCYGWMTLIVAPLDKTADFSQINEQQLTDTYNDANWKKRNFRKLMSVRSLLTAYIAALRNKQRIFRNPMSIGCLFTQWRHCFICGFFHQPTIISSLQPIIAPVDWWICFQLIGFFLLLPLAEAERRWVRVLAVEVRGGPEGLVRPVRGWVPGLLPRADGAHHLQQAPGVRGVQAGCTGMYGTMCWQNSLGLNWIWPF